MFPHLRIFCSNVGCFFFHFFFSWMIFILLFKRVLIILVTDLYRCYKYLSFHFRYDIFFCGAEDFDFNMVKVVSLFLYGLLCVGVCFLFRKIPFTLQVHKDIVLCSSLKINFAFHIRF